MQTPFPKKRLLTVVNEGLVDCRMQCKFSQTSAFAIKTERRLNDRSTYFSRIACAKKSGKGE